MNAPEDFDELLDLYMPWDDGVAVVLKAFFDAGERPKGTFCVGGLAFGKDNLKKAEREWRKVYGDRIGHMTDLHVRKKAFDGITDAESDAFMRGSIRIINRYATYGVAVSCDRDEAAGVLPTEAYADYQSTELLKGLSNRYAVCCHLAMHIMGSLVKQSPKTSNGIVYVFEKGDIDQAKSNQFIEYVTRFELMKFLYAYRSHGYLDKKDAAMLQRPTCLLGNGQSTSREDLKVRSDLADRSKLFWALMMEK